MPRKKSSPLSLQGSVYLGDERRASLTAAQINLLKAIRDTGSITAAAKAVGISYKTAWDRVDAMNNLANSPLVQRSTGGAGGGGTRLTPKGEAMIEGFEALARQHGDFVRRMGRSLHSVDDVAQFLQHASLSTSARNQFLCSVEAIERGAVNVELQLRAGAALTLIAHITADSMKTMGLKKGSQVLALIKSTWIILAQGDVVTSARNRLQGTVSRVVRGKVNSEVSLDLGDGKTLFAQITNASLEHMGLERGAPVTALFKASSILLIQP